MGKSHSSGSAGVREAAAKMVSSSKSHQHDRDLFRPDLYINRELSAVSFIRRVLEEARSKRHPLLERLKFLSFVSRQIDEFLMIRVAGLQDQQIAQVKEVGPDGLLPGQQLDALRAELLSLFSSQHHCWIHELLPQLFEAGIAILDYSQLSRAQREAAAIYYEQEVFPVLTPLGVDPAHPFPHISSRSLNLAVSLTDPQGIEFFARVKVPSLLPRLIPVPQGTRERSRRSEPDSPKQFAFVWIEQVITAHLDSLFPGMSIKSAYPFRVLRDADFDIQRDQAGDLLETVEQNVQLRRFGVVVDLAVQPDMPESIRNLLRENLQLDAQDIMDLEGPLGLGDLLDLCDLDRPDLKDQPIVATVPAELRRSADIFSAIQKSDILLHHPYNTFSTVAEFIETAARDSQVVAIKQTLYRVGQNSRIVDALLEANDRGKQVAVLVELKARFDEENNIEWARRLESSGVHVVFGQVELKTHAKVALVVRREAGGLRRYVHIGTGNYNASTARVYEDYALLTCRADIGEDASHLFNAMTGYARGVVYNKLMVAPESIRLGLLARIDREIERQQAGGAGHLIFKINALVDPEFIRALYRASQAGVKVDLIVRGMCCLRPGIPGISENIQVISLVGRFLEHSRIYYFANGGIEEEEILIGSADLMQRNLDHRVEVLVPVEDPGLRAHFTGFALSSYQRDSANAWRLLSNGTYERILPAHGEAPFDQQIWFAHHGTPRTESEVVPLLYPVTAE